MTSILQHPEQLIEGLEGFSRIAIITQEPLAQLYGKSISEKLNADLFTFPDGEAYKTRETKQQIEDQLLEKGYGRDTCIIALGGGVVTDLAGFVAATYCRGVPLVLVPTTLLAMVDASIGGKTGVNTPQGKNLIGAFYQPKKVVIDTHFLQTLPLSRIKEGIAEMIKHALIADAGYFSFLENHSKQLLSLEKEVLEKAIFESRRIKQDIVEVDAKENGKRRLLNAGHTIGHALEKLSNYTLPHGEAVALGLLIEALLANLPDIVYERIYNILKIYGLPLQLPSSYSEQALLDALLFDKKSDKGKPRFVMLQEIGQPLSFDGHYCTPIEELFIKDALSKLKRY